MYDWVLTNSKCQSLSCQTHYYRCCGLNLPLVFVSLDTKLGWKSKDTSGTHFCYETDGSSLASLIFSNAILRQYLFFYFFRRIPLTARLTLGVFRSCLYIDPSILCSNTVFYVLLSDIWSLGCVLYELLTLKHAVSTFHN